MLEASVISLVKKVPVGGGVVCASRQEMRCGKIGVPKDDPAVKLALQNKDLTDEQKAALFTATVCPHGFTCRGLAERNSSLPVPEVGGLGLSLCV